jgi:hypothetical protein
MTSRQAASLAALGGALFLLFLLVAVGIPYLARLLFIRRLESIRDECFDSQGLGIVTLCPFYSCRVESEGLGVLVASRAWWRAGGCDAGVPGRFGGSRWRADRGCQAIWLWPSGRFTRIL